MKIPETKLPLHPDPTSLSRLWVFRGQFHPAVVGLVLVVLGFIYNKYQGKIREWL